MRLLLDTHAFLWSTSSPDKLSSAARDACENPANLLYLSHASVWEMLIKEHFGKLRIEGGVRPLIEAEHGQVKLLPISLAHLWQLSSLPPHHRDPFDRLLLAQAAAEGMALVTADATLHKYGLPIVW